MGLVPATESTPCTSSIPRPATPSMTCCAVSFWLSTSAAALHSGGPAFATLPAYFDQRLEPALQSLLDAAAGSGEMRSDVRPYDLLRAVASLCMPLSDGDPEPARRLVALLVDGLRYRAKP